MSDIGTSAIPLGVALTFITTVIIGVWNFKSELSKSEKAIDERAVNQRRELVELIDATGRRFGDTVQAAKQKMFEVELWATKELVTKREFADDLGAMRSDLKALGERIDKRMDSEFSRINEKLDRAAEWSRHLQRGESPE